MDLEITVLQQRVNNIKENFSNSWTQQKINANTFHSRAFVLLVFSHVLATDDYEYVANCIVDGGEDGGIDAISVEGGPEGYFQVRILQTKYTQVKQNETTQQKTKNNAFPLTAIEKIAANIESLFDTESNPPFNQKLLAAKNVIQNFLEDGDIPQIKVYFSSLGCIWDSSAQKFIDANKIFQNPQVNVQFVNSSQLIQSIVEPKPLPRTRINLSGPAIAEDIPGCRIFLGRINVSEVFNLVDSFGNQLFEQNIRKYLGSNSSQINKQIAKTLQQVTESDYFYTMNNGITAICDQFSFNSIGQTKDFTLSVSGIQIVNGGQTAQTIFNTLKAMPVSDRPNSSVLIRIYQVDKELKPEFIERIVHSTNSQNPVSLFELKSISQKQRLLAKSVQNLNCKLIYDPKKSEATIFARKNTAQQDLIGFKRTAVALCAVWFGEPNWMHKISNQWIETHYDVLFPDSVNGAHVCLAVYFLRAAEAFVNSDENLEKQPYLFYSKFYFARLIAFQTLLKVGKISLAHNEFWEFPKGTKWSQLASQISPKIFPEINKFWQKNSKQIVEIAQKNIEEFSTSIGITLNIPRKTMSERFRSAETKDKFEIFLLKLEI
jgi:AIPR protein